MTVKDFPHSSLQRRMIREIKVVIRRKVEITTALMLKNATRTLPLTQKTPPAIIADGLQICLV